MSDMNGSNDDKRRYESLAQAEAERLAGLNNMELPKTATHNDAIRRTLGFLASQITQRYEAQDEQLREQTKPLLELIAEVFLGASSAVDDQDRRIKLEILRRERDLGMFGRVN